MRSRTAKYFECFVRYDKTMEDGKQKNVTEQYTVDALSFTEAEADIIKEMKPNISGDYEVKNINPAAYGEIFFSDKDTDDKWYKVKLAFITIDEKTEKEKKAKVTYLVQANSLEQARKNTEEVMNGTAIDYEFVSVTETKILDVFEYGGKSEAEPAE